MPAALIRMIRPSRAPVPRGTTHAGCRDPAARDGRGLVTGSTIDSPSGWTASSPEQRAGLARDEASTGKESVRMGEEGPGDATSSSASCAIERASATTTDRSSLWREIASGLGAEIVAEIGVWKGEFAEDLLRSRPAIHTYYMVDPWRHLSDWNKPYNVADDRFEDVRREALDRTAFADDRRRVLRGTTVDVAKDLPDRSFDLCYIDGDHTLRGILIDLIRLYPKVRDGGILGGDDFIPSAWQHGERFEPTLVFPTALYFAEATGSLVYGLPHRQFAIVVDRSRDAFAFRDLTGLYSEPTLRAALGARPAGLAGRVVGKLRTMIQ